jgi:hypothetical protein
LNILSEGITTVGVEDKLELARWSSGNALLVGCILTVATLYAVDWMYRRESRGNVTRRLRLTLVGCRVLVLAMLGLIGLEPVVVKYVHRRLAAYTLVLVDDSASMSLSDRYRLADEARLAQSVVNEVPPQGVARSKVCETILERDDGQWLKSLAQKNEVKVFSFSNRARLARHIPRSADGVSAGQNETPLDETQKEPSEPAQLGKAGAIPLGADGPVTDIGRAVRGAIDSVGGAPVAGVVLLTDGGFNRGESAAVVGRYLREKHVPLCAIGVGDPAEPVNVRVTQVAAPRSVFKNDPFSVTVKVTAQGVGDEPIEIELHERRLGEEGDDDSAARLVETQTIHADADGRIAPVVFKRKVARPGEVGYLVRVRPLSYEAVTSDNQRETLPAVRILDDKMKVLLIAGSPSYDYRFCTRLLERDATVELSTWLQSADVTAVRDGNKVITELPETLEAMNKYDAIILMDCDPKEFGPTWGSLVSLFVSDHGGGVLFAAGNKFTGRFFRSANMHSLVEVFPIVPDPEAEIVINELGHYQMRAWPILIPDDAASDPILRQSDDTLATKAIWADLGEVYWHYPVRREKPIAHVLMRHANPQMANTFGPHVLLATQFVGTGRTAYLGINSTWRWRRSDEQCFNRFWIQMSRFLVEGKLLGGRARGRILTSKDQYELGDTVVLTVRALDEAFGPLLMPELPLRVAPVAGRSSASKGEAANAETVSLTPIPGREGYYEGRFVPIAVGTIKLTLGLPGAAAEESEDGSAEVSREIVVSRPDIEMRNTAMDRAGLSTLAEAVGGRSRYLGVDEADSVSSLIEDRSRTVVVRGRPRSLWDNRYVFAVLIGLLTLEWIGRKKAKLL